MKFTIAASLAAFTMAAEQTFTPTATTPPVDNTPKEPMDDQWTNNQIKNYVAKNHGGYEWQAFEMQQLLTEESRMAYVGTVINELVTDWQSTQKHLPNVCAAGVACRKKINDQLIIDLEAKWSLMLVNIDNKLVGAKARINAQVVSYYQDAYKCEPGCECDNISKEYDQLVSWQDEASGRIASYVENLNGLIANEQTIIASCPAYIYDVDGNAYFDYSGAAASSSSSQSEVANSGSSTISQSSDSSSSATYNVDGKEVSQAEFDAMNAANSGSSSSSNSGSSSSSQTYNVNGQEVSQAEFDAMNAANSGDSSSSNSGSSSQTYNVDGQEVSQAEFDAMNAGGSDPNSDPNSSSNSGSGDYYNLN